MQGRYSLRRRMLLTLVPVLLLAMLLLGLALDQSYRSASESALFERLQLQLRLLMADTEVLQSGVRFPEQASEPALNQAQSGLAGLVVDDDASLLWRSGSAQASTFDWRELVDAIQPLAGLREQGALFSGALQGWYFVARRVAFSLSAIDTPAVDSAATGNASSELLSPVYTIVVLDNGKALAMQQQAYRAELWRWLGIAVVALALLQLLLLFWSFRPLAELTEELRRVERGKQQTFSGDYPAEIAPLTENLNHFVESERKQRERYRNTLADLAHSLKTPLAALRSGIESNAPADSLQESIASMDEIISYQLNRARPLTAHRMAQQESGLDDLLPPLLRSLEKVYRAKTVAIEQLAEPGIRLQMGSDQAMELLGNVLDNAFKYCRGRVAISAVVKNGLCLLRIEDDGAGIPAHRREEALARGRRLDEREPGQGIGLAVVAEIVADSGGQLFIEQSGMGGACVSLRLPAAG